MADSRHTLTSSTDFLLWIQHKEPNMVRYKTEKESDEAKGRLVIDIAKIIAQVEMERQLSDDDINAIVRPLMLKYKVFFLKPIRFFSDYQKRVKHISDRNVSTAEYIGHALNKTLSATYKTFYEAYREDKHGDLQYILKAMIYVNDSIYHDTSNLFVDRAEKLTIIHVVSEAINNYKRSLITTRSKTY